MSSVIENLIKPYIEEYMLDNYAVVRVSPELAAELLKFNPKFNRTASKAHILQLANNIRKGTFYCNPGDKAITFSRMEDGQEFLTDGQHRLKAIALAGIPTQIMIAWDVSLDVRKYTDIMRARRAGNVVALQQIVDKEDAAGFAALGRWITYWDKGERVITRSYGKSGSLYETIDEEVQTYASIRDQLLDGLDWGRALRGPLKTTITAGGAAYVVTARVNPESAEHFFSALIDEEAILAANHPIYTCRKRLLESASGRVRPLNDCEQFTLLIMAWNAWRAGKKVDRFRLPTPVEADSDTDLSDNKIPDPV